jgi:hypothetical protein
MEESNLNNTDLGGKEGQHTAHQTHPTHGSAEAPHIHHVHEHKPEKTHKAGSYKYLALSAAIYLLIALVMFYNISSNAAKVAPGVGGDTYQNLWDIWWVGFATLKVHSGIFFTNMLFWPIGSNLVYQTMSPLGALLSLPFQAISIPFAYNFLFFIGFVLSGIGMYLLADYVVENRNAAFLAGLFFAFSSFHIAQAYSHIDWMNIGWAPFAIYFLLRMMKERGRKVYYFGVGLAISMVLLTFMGDIEQALMISFVLMGAIIACFAFSSTRKDVLRKEFWMSFGTAIIIAFVLGSWGFIPIISTILHPGGLSTANYLNTVTYNELWSGDLLSFFLPSVYNGLLTKVAQSYYTAIFSKDLTERVSYIGYVVLALSAFGIYKNWKKSRLWLVLAVIAALMVLGPYIQINGTITKIPSLYLLYHYIPVINIVREPGRFNFILTIATAILAAIGFKALSDKFSNTKQRALLLAAVVAILFLIESNGMALGPVLNAITVTHVNVPVLYGIMANSTANFSILSLPAFSLQGSPTPNLFTGQQTYYAAIAKKPLVGGYVTRENTTQQLSLYNIPLAVEASSLANGGNYNYSTPVIENLTNMSLLTLYNYNTAYVTVSTQAYTNQSLEELYLYLKGVFGTPIYEDNTTMAFATSNAIAKSIYKSFVGYPLLSEWSVATIPYNGTYQTLWLPDKYGPIIVYAPYPNGTDIQTALYSNTNYYVNATMSFYAEGNGASKLSILESSGSSYQTAATFNLTSSLSYYSVNMRMPSGPSGAELIFAAQTNQSVAIKGIQFSLAKNG